jgi:hypothetical protein
MWYGLELQAWKIFRSDINKTKESDMSVKQIQMKFQVAANNGVAAQVTITSGGIVKFSGDLAQTVPVLIAGDVLNISEPDSTVLFDLDIPDQPVEHPKTPEETAIPVELTIAVTGGNIGLQDSLANYSSYCIEVSPPTDPVTYTLAPGDATTFKGMDYATQPVWTPPATDRLNIADNVDTGPGSLILLDGESVTYQVSVWLYSDAVVFSNFTGP